jgi:hypothetical protein
VIAGTLKTDVGQEGNEGLDLTAVDRLAIRQHYQFIEHFKDSGKKFHFAQKGLILQQLQANNFYCSKNLIESNQKVTTTAGLEPAILRSEV